MSAKGRRRVRALLKLLLQLGAIEVDRRRTLPALIPHLKRLQREGHKVVLATVPNTGRTVIVVDRDVLVPVWEIPREEELLGG